MDFRFLYFSPFLFLFSPPIQYALILSPLHHSFPVNVVVKVVTVVVVVIVVVIVVLAVVVDVSVMAHGFESPFRRPMQT